ncbi:MAG: hypothetical protein WCX81_04200 [Monoglobales bacterium]
MGIYGSPELYPDNGTKENKNLIYCQKCGFRFSKKIRKCPQCNQKYIAPFYNKWWFWVLAVLVFFAIYPNLPEKPAGIFTHTETQTIPEDKFKQMCVEIPYNEIARKPKDYQGHRATYTGQVVQVQENETNTILRVNITKNQYNVWTDTVYVDYKRKTANEQRILENDIITLYGTVNGTKTYQSVLGNQITISHIIAEYIEIK